MTTWASSVRTAVQLCSEEAWDLPRSNVFNAAVQQVVGDAGRTPELVYQVRAELHRLLEQVAAVDVRHVLAVLCRVPAATEIGYAPEKLGMSVEQIDRLERAGYQLLWERVTAETPFFHALKACCTAEAEVGAEQWGRESEAERLLTAARRDPHFDLRAHMPPALELHIRQQLGRHGLTERERVRALVAADDRFAVDLVAERMLLEQGEHELEREEEWL